MGAVKQSAKRNKRVASRRLNQCQAMRDRKAEIRLLASSTQLTTSQPTASSSSVTSASAPITSTTSSKSAPSTSASSSITSTTSSSTSAPPTSASSPITSATTSTSPPSISPPSPITSDISTSTPYTPLSTTTTITNNTSASKKKLDSTDFTDTSTTQDQYIIININTLQNIFSEFQCPKCHQNGTIKIDSKESSRRGFGHYIRTTCSSCVFEKSTFTSQALPDKTLDINQKAVVSFLSCGLGFAGMNTFCEVMGMAGMSQTTFTSHVATIHDKVELYKCDMLDDAVARVQKHHGTETGILDLAISFDGSWQKRGHTSHHGIGAGIEVNTGLVIDCQVMASYCQTCAQFAEKKLAEGESAYNDWFATHNDSCTIKHEGCWQYNWRQESWGLDSIEDWEAAGLLQKCCGQQGSYY